MGKKAMHAVRRGIMWLKHRVLRTNKIESDVRGALSNIGPPNERELGLLVMGAFSDSKLMAVLTKVALLRIKRGGFPKKNQVHKALVVLHKLSIESTWAKEEMRTQISNILKTSFYSGKSVSAQEIRALSAAVLKCLLNMKTSRTQITEFFSCISGEAENV